VSQKNHSQDTPELEEQKEDGRSSSVGRREALKKVGRYAAYTAPAMLALMLSKDATGY
jgi:hypothetical protein